MSALNRFERLFELLPDDIDCALITSDVNRRYFTGMKSSDGTVLAFRDKAYLIIDFRYIEKARESVSSAEVIEQKKLFPQILELLKKHSAHIMAIESQTMTVAELEKLTDFLMFENVDVNQSHILSTAISNMRMVKDCEEIEYIKKAQQIAEEAYSEILKFIKAGVSEREIALELNRQMLIRGAEDISFETIVLSGANTSMPHGVPSDKLVENGDFVLMDFGAVYNGYHSDMTRTVCVGEPSDEMKKVYDTVLQAQLACLEAAHAGMTGAELDKIARDIISEAGYGENFGHSLGHGTGLEIHELPNASPNYSHTLRKNSVVTVEPGIYLAGKFGVRIEDFVILTENDCVNLTKCAKNIISL